MWQRSSMQEIRSKETVIRGRRDDAPYYIMTNIQLNSCLQFPNFLGEDHVSAILAAVEKRLRRIEVLVSDSYYSMFCLTRKKKQKTHPGGNCLFCRPKQERVCENLVTFSMGRLTASALQRGNNMMRKSQETKIILKYNCGQEKSLLAMKK